MESQTRFQDFVRAYWTNWFAVMSGGPSVPAAILALYVQNEIAKILLWITVAVAIILSAYLVWRVERLKVIKLDTRARSEAVRANWGRLRGEGVDLRNEGGRGLFTEDQWEKWRADIVTWNTEVLASIRLVSDADAEWFAILDTVPSPRIAMDAMFQTDHDEHVYAMHDFRLVKLEQLILKHGALRPL